MILKSGDFKYIFGFLVSSEKSEVFPQNCGKIVPTTPHYNLLLEQLTCHLLFKGNSQACVPHCHCQLL